jgi:molecular chaperone GrpE
VSEKEDKEPKNESAEEQVADFDAQNAPLDFTEGANDEMAEALREKDQFKRLAQRAQADLVNYRRRIEGEQESSRLRNQQRIVLRFADVIDQLDVALSSDTLGAADASWLEGITAIQKNFLNAMMAEGFERFTSVGETFDPHKHEALLSTATSEYEPDTVVTELRPGYMRNDEVVRPAQVQISTAPEEDGDDGDS